MSRVLFIILNNLVLQWGKFQFVVNYGSYGCTVLLPITMNTIYTLNVNCFGTWDDNYAGAMVGIGRSDLSSFEITAAAAGSNGIMYFAPCDHKYFNFLLIGM